MEAGGSSITPTDVAESKFEEDDAENQKQSETNSSGDKKLDSPVKIREDLKTKTAEVQSPVPESGSPSSEAKKKDKINILLKPVGDAPILKQRLWAVDPDKPISSILIFTKSYLKLEADQSLFFFVNQAFAPSPDQLIRNIYECFGSDGKLILNYSTTTAWG